MSGTSGSSSTSIPAWVKAQNSIGQFPTEGQLKELASHSIPDARKPQTARYEPLSAKQQLGLFAPGAVLLMTAEHFRIVNKGDGNVVVSSEIGQASMLLTGTEYKEPTVATPIESVRRKIKEQQQRSRQLNQAHQENDPLIAEARQIMTQDKKIANKVRSGTDVLRHLGKFIKLNISDAMFVVHATHEERRRAKEERATIPQGKKSEKGMLGMSRSKKASMNAIRDNKAETTGNQNGRQG